MKNKILIFIFCGLLLGRVSPLYGAESSVSVISPQDAWTFLQNNISGEEYNSFTNKYGKARENLNDKFVVCGVQLCNVEEAKCLAKKKEIKDYKGDNYFGYPSVDNSSDQANNKTEDAGDKSNTSSAPDNIQLNDITSYEYACLTDPILISLRTKEGWQDITQQLPQQDRNWQRQQDSCYKAKSNNGEVTQYCVKLVGDKIEVIGANFKADGCESIPVSLYNDSKCRFCSMLGIVIATAENITTISRNNLSWSFAIIILVGMGIWIAIKTLIFVSSMTKQDAAKYITEMLKQSYKFVIAFFLLIYFNDVFNFIINPLLNAGLNFGTQFVSNEYTLQERFNIPDLSRASFENLGENLPKDYVRNLNNQYYNIGIYATLENFAYNVNLRYALLQSIGRGLSCLGIKYLLLQFGTSFELIGLGIACLIYGAFFWVFGFLLTLAFIFYIFDAVVQLGIVGGLLPFLIASWPFKITSKYTSTGFKLLLNSIFTFIMMGVVVMISIALISKAVELNTSIKTGDEQTGTGLAILVDAINKIDTNKLKIMVNILSVGFLVFLFASILGFLLLARVSELTNRFASGGMKASAPGIATMGASAAKGTIGKVTAPTRKAVGKWMERKTQRATRSAVNFGVGLVTLRPLRKGAANKVDNLVSSKGGSSNQRSDAGNGGQTNNQQTRATVGKGGGQTNNQQTQATVGNGKSQSNNQANNSNTSPNSGGNNSSPSDQNSNDIRHTADEREDSLMKLNKKLAELSQPKGNEDDLSRQIRENLKAQVEAHLNWRTKDKAQSQMNKSDSDTNTAPSSQQRRPNRKNLDELD